jgi:hypothetical protein
MAMGKFVLWLPPASSELSTTAVSEEVCRGFASSRYRGKKPKCAVGKLFLVLDTTLRHIDDAPRHHLPHRASIGGPGTFAA